MASSINSATDPGSAPNLQQWLCLDGARIRYPRKHEIATGLASHGDLSSFPISAAERAQLNNEDNCERAERILRWLGQADTTLLTLADRNYPARLLEVARPPLLLFVKGSIKILSAQQIAIVGSRHPTHGGLETAHDFAASLADGGFVITSGLARGIDGAAHRGCLKAGVPTIAVAATGLDQVYPPEHKDLANEIVAKGGTIISEFAPGVAPRAQNFPRRNRIISGLSVGTLVVEAAVHSGSLITARFALEQGREVFAIPGSIHNPAARGCHHLIRQGAKLVEQVDDILEELNWITTPAPALNNAVIDSTNKTQIKNSTDNRTETVSAIPQASKPAIRNVTAEKVAGIEGTTDQKLNMPGGALIADTAGNDLEPNAVKILECIDFSPTDIETIVRRSSLTASEVSIVLVTLELRGLVCKSAGFFNRRGTIR
ncbi:MAG: hypothetical protein DHS20C01_03670 [marine bacterium B5-7]|nr:MAG: hypothetical protein DHS20C01_03670 [marine bacterium B5-7]